MRHTTSSGGRSYTVIDLGGAKEVTVPNRWWVAFETVFSSIPNDVPPGTVDDSTCLSESCVVIALGDDPSAVRRNIRSVTFRPEVTGKQGGPFTGATFLWYAQKFFVIVVLSQTSSRDKGPGRSRKHEIAFRFVWPHEICQGELKRGSIPVREMRSYADRAAANDHDFMMLSDLAKVLGIEPGEVVERYSFLAGRAEGFDNLFVHAESQLALAKGQQEKFVVKSAMARELSVLRGRSSQPQQTIDKVWVPLDLARQLILLDRFGVASETDLCPWKTYGQ